MQSSSLYFSYIDARDRMSQHVFKNPNQLAGCEETAFADQEEQDSLSKP